MNKTICRISERDLIIGLAYVAAVFSYFAYQRAQAAHTEAAEARRHAVNAGVDIRQHRDAVEDVDEDWTELEDLEPAVEEIDDEGDE